MNKKLWKNIYFSVFFFCISVILIACDRQEMKAISLVEESELEDESSTASGIATDEGQAQTQKIVQQIPLQFLCMLPDR